jgi:hypothetical protein
MNTHTWIRALCKASLAASLVALIAACGGGSSSTGSGSAGGSGTAQAPDAPPAKPVAWGSPAAFVPQGAQEKSFALNECRLAIDDEGDELYKASMKIAANGDVSIAASKSPDGSPVTVWRISYEQAQGSSWLAGGTLQTPTYTLGVQSQVTETLATLLVLPSGETSSSVLAFNFLDGVERPTQSIQCELTEQLTLQMRPDAARVAANLGTSAGVTTGITAGVEEESISVSTQGSLVTWDNLTSSEANRFMQFDLSSGSLAVSPSEAGPFTKLDFSLPAGQAAEGSPTALGVYGESNCLAPELLLTTKSKVVCWPWFQTSIRQTTSSSRQAQL